MGSMLHVTIYSSTMDPSWDMMDMGGFWQMPHINGL